MGMNNKNVDITAEMVIAALNLSVLKKTAREIFVTCPFCGDNRKKAAFTVSKSLFHCVVCENGGNAWSVYKKVTGLDKSEAFKRLMQEAGDYTPSTVAPIAQDEEPAAELQILNKVYKTLMSVCTLSEEHKKDLIKRGLNEEQIKKIGFFSMPKNTEGVCRKLLAKGLSLKNVPGFFVNRNGNWDMFSQGSGYFCPVYDTSMGQMVTGFQIRMDNPKDGRKYLWFSTSGYNKGTKSGSQACYLKGKNKDITIVTEGILKAIVIYFLLGQAVSVIGVPGITTIACAEKFFQNQTFIIEAFDMDKRLTAEELPLLDECKKLAKAKRVSFSELFTDKAIRDKYAPVWRTYNIAKATKKLCETFERYGKPYHKLIWNQSGNNWKGEIKGIDDFLASFDDKDKFIAYLAEKASDAQALSSFLE